MKKAQMLWLGLIKNLLSPRHELTAALHTNVQSQVWRPLGYAGAPRSSLDFNWSVRYVKLLKLPNQLYNP